MLWCSTGESVKPAGSSHTQQAASSGAETAGAGPPEAAIDAAGDVWQLASLSHPPYPFQSVPDVRTVSVLKKYIRTLMMMVL